MSTLQAGHILIGCDPGGTTGLCIVRYTGAPGRNFDVVSSLEVPWRDRFTVCDMVETWASPAQLYRLVVEDFILHPGVRGPLAAAERVPSAKVIGMLEFFMNQLGLLDRLVLQPAYVRRAVRILPDHATCLCKSPHCEDAYRHVRYYLVTHLNAQHQKRQP